LVRLHSYVSLFKLLTLIPLPIRRLVACDICRESASVHALHLRVMCWKCR
jgi:hypothetical protein